MPYNKRLPAAPLKRELRRVRRAHALTWEQLAVRLDVSQRTLSRLLRSRDIAEQVADRMTCRLGLHPALLWPKQWLQPRRNGRDSA